MNKKEFQSLLKDRILTIDGAMGTMLQVLGLRDGIPPDAAAIEQPDLLEKVHREYVDAGADVILTNTFGATPARLGEYGLEDSTEKINIASVRVARKASGGRSYVAASVGPGGSFLTPVGTTTFDEAYDSFLQQAVAFKKETPDFIIFETFADIREIKAAIIAFREVLPGIPVVAQMTFDEEGRTVTGTDPESFVVVMEALGCDAAGVNCSVGPAEMLPVFQQMAKTTHLPLSIEPNAGLPRLVNGKPVYDLSADDFGEYVDHFIEAGASLIGSCCGSTPDFTSVIASRVKGKKPVKREEHDYLRLAGRTRTVSFKPGSTVLPVGERINPAGRKLLKAELKEGKMDIVRREAIDQEKAGAGALDINVSAYRADERELLIKAVETVQSVSHLPVVLDNSDPGVLEDALKVVEGKPLINSTSGEDEKLIPIIRLAVKYGAAIVGIALDENGIPETPGGRVKIAGKILETAASMGMQKKDILLDALVLSASTGANQLQTTMGTLELLKSKFAVTTILGVSNSSFGLPNRQAINSTYLSIALQKGLDIPIIDPLDEKIRDVLYSFNLLKGYDTGGKEYIAEMSGRTEDSKADDLLKDEKQQASVTHKDQNIIEVIKKTIIDGDRSAVIQSVNKAIEGPYTALEIVNSAMVPAMSEVGRLFNEKLYFLPQVILSAESMKEGFTLLKSQLKGDDEKKKETIVFATVKGDVHDLGKNIVITLLESYGFNVIDLGKSIPAEDIITNAVEHDAFCIALSALMTTTMGEMKTVCDLARERGLDIPIIIGGAVISQDYADEIGASYGKDAIEAVRVITAIDKR